MHVHYAPKSYWPAPVDLIGPNRFVFSNFSKKKKIQVSHVKCLCISVYDPSVFGRWPSDFRLFRPFLPRGKPSRVCSVSCTPFAGGTSRPPRNSGIFLLFSSAFVAVYINVPPYDRNGFILSGDDFFFDLTFCWYFPVRLYETLEKSRRRESISAARIFRDGKRKFLRRAYFVRTRRYARGMSGFFARFHFPVHA